ITLHARPEAACPGLPGYSRKHRDRAEADWFEFDENLAREIADARNDMLHAGFNQNNATPATLEAKARSLTDRFAQASLQPPVDRPALLVNLTNHPLFSWPPEQLAQARNLAERLEDVAVPEVPPEATEKEVDE